MTRSTTPNRSGGKTTVTHTNSGNKSTVTKTQTNPKTGVTKTQTTRTNKNTGSTSTKTTVTKKPTNSSVKTSTVKHNDGSRTVTKTTKNGTKTVTNYRKDGSRETVRGNTRTVVSKDGKSREVTKTVRGRTTTVKENIKIVNNTRILNRTYVRNGHSYSHNYRGYAWGGRYHYAYIPVYRYDPWFYGYCYHPWISWSYSWGWAYDPWYGYYGYYYHPYPVYAGPAYWLTDYLISDLLAASYANNVAVANANAANAEAQAQAAAAQAQAAAAEAQAAAAEINSANRIANTQESSISDDEKDQIKAQVEETIKEHQSNESPELAKAAADPKQIFVVDSGLDVSVVGSDKSCSLSEGAFLKLAEPLREGDEEAQVLVKKSKKGDCPAGVTVTVSSDDLQDMLNGFSSRVEAGMEKMKSDKKLPQAQQ